MYILVIWTVIASSTIASSGSYEKMGWRPIGEFSSLKTCQEAGLLLNVKPEAMRCLKK